jgi:hypothetical protein
VKLLLKFQPRLISDELCLFVLPLLLLVVDEATVLARFSVSLSSANLEIDQFSRARRQKAKNKQISLMKKEFQ